jgi:GxxExxY protein
MFPFPIEGTPFPGRSEFSTMSDYRNDSNYRNDSGRGNGGGRGGSYGGGRSGGGRDGYREGGRDGGRDGGQRRGLPLSELDPALTDVSRKVIGCAIEVHRSLGPGFAEEVYLQSLAMELSAIGVAFTSHEQIPVLYKDQRVGTITADLHIEGRFIVEVMARPGEIGSHERSGLRAQLKASDHELGLIINFAERRLKDGLVRVLNMEKININRGEEGGEDDLDARGMVDFEENN